MKQETSKEVRHRYYLHRCLKRRYNINAHKRLIEVPFTDFESEIPEPFKSWLNELSAKNYTIQSTII